MDEINKAAIEQITWPDGRPPWATGYFMGKRLDEEQWLIIHPLIGGRARLSIMTAESSCVEAWCMPNTTVALVSYILWPEPPQGWTRHMTKAGNFYPDSDAPVDDAQS